MGNKNKVKFAAKFVRPLHLAEERFLEVLLSEFEILRKVPPATPGFQLLVCFDDNTPAVWEHSGRRYLRKLVAREKFAAYQRELDAFLLGDVKGAAWRKSYEFNDPRFVFRYVSGGTLPIMRFAGGQDANEYYCLMYREVNPIGWNLANGGSDNRAELLNPQLTIERELREELIIADSTVNRRYELGPVAREAADLPAHAVARKLWDEYLPSRNLRNLEVVEVPVTWVQGPDSLRVRMGNEGAITRDGFFININGEDFGIELDRVARITLPENAILFSGEMVRGHLLNNPIGLFNVNRFPSNIPAETLQSKVVRPDFFFFDGKLHTGDQIDEIARGPYLDHVRTYLGDKDLKRFEERLAADSCFGLCPVTARIILRHSRWSGSGKKRQAVEGASAQGEDVRPDVAGSAGGAGEATGTVEGGTGMGVVGAAGAATGATGSPGSGAVVAAAAVATPRPPLTKRTALRVKRAEAGRRGRTAVTETRDREAIRAEVTRLTSLPKPLSKNEAYRRVAVDAQRGRAGEQRLTRKYDTPGHMVTEAVVRRICRAKW